MMIELVAVMRRANARGILHARTTTARFGAEDDADYNSVKFGKFVPDYH